MGLRIFASNWQNHNFCRHMKKSTFYIFLRDPDFANPYSSLLIHTDPYKSILVSGILPLVDCELRRGNFESRQLRAVAVSARDGRGLRICRSRNKSGPNELRCTGGRGCYLATDSKHLRHSTILGWPAIFCCVHSVLLVFNITCLKF